MSSSKTHTTGLLLALVAQAAWSADYYVATNGSDAAAAAAETARKTFEEGSSLGGELPSFDIPAAELEAGIAAFELFRRVELAASNGEARRLIKGGGGKLNDKAIGNETQAITLADRNADGVIKLSAGKKRHIVIRAQ